MGIFDIHQHVIDDYQKYVRSFLTIADDQIRDFITETLLEQSELWPDALLQLNPAYELGSTVQELVGRGDLHPLCADIFRDKKGQSICLYTHQEEAILRALQQEHFVVTSGTGSGKSLTYMIPIFDHILKYGEQKEKVHAIIVYPMNALVNSQKIAVNNLLSNLGGSKDLIRIRSYTGQQDASEKFEIRSHPPHVLLTNYVMLELMMTRPQEHTFVENSSLAFLIMDELHTYRGRQGADVAMLIRRLRERCENPNLLCIGTSATMASGNSRSERRAASAAFASKLFGVDVEEENVIEETLRRIIPISDPPQRDELIRSLREALPGNSWEDFSRNPLSSWIEDTFGLEMEEDGRLKRRIPITLKNGARQLSEKTGLEEAECAARLQEMFLLGSQVNTPDDDIAFAFKLHQFIAQGGSVYATLEHPQDRYLTIEGQFYAPGTGKRLLYPLLFCRICGQEYYSVEWRQDSERLRPNIAGQSPGTETEDMNEEVIPGYVMSDPEGRWRNEAEFLPDHWIDRNGSVSRSYRKYLPRSLYAKPDGEITDGADSHIMPYWFIPQPFMLCLRCGEAYTGYDREFRKLAGLSSGGRSSSNTVLALSTVDAMGEDPTASSEKKVLSFTDNIQDASLQAGHFNDFVQVALLRSALYHALQKHGELRFENIASRVLEEMNIPLSEFANQAGLDPSSPLAENTKEVFQEVLEYRLYEDLRRGWRVLQPNLGQCGLLRIDYEGLDDLASREDKWNSTLLLSDISAEKRKEILRAILDEIRRRLAISAECLSRSKQRELSRRAQEYLNEQWSFSQEERLHYAPRFILPENDSLPGDAKLTQRSIIGRWLRKQAEDNGIILAENDYNQLIEAIVEVLCGFGLLVEQHQRVKNQVSRGVMIPPKALIWRPGDGNPEIDVMRHYQATGAVYESIDRQANEFFLELYKGDIGTLKGMEAAEHTGRTKTEQRIERETRFGKGELSCLFCSPTMELGIDIADLNAVHMRNIPPTPANYAQRSGRSGRAGQPAIVLAYCGSGRGHDQYFFQRREQMVAGSVVPPRLDLSNESLILAHINAIWLAKTGLSLERSVLNVLDTDNTQENYPLLEEIREQINLPEHKLAECLKESSDVLKACEVDPESALWFRDQWLDEKLRSAPQRFDEAFDRWRELFRAAMDQLKASQTMSLGLYSSKRSTDDKDMATDPEVLQREAKRQLDLLCCRNIRSDESDFNPYRYLASEGFLPGYNFPALPVRAYIPRGDRGEYISRSRFLALTEFGPSNRIYHEGAQYEVQRAFLTIKEPEKRFARMRVCQMCGYIHEWEEHLEECTNCGTKLVGDAKLDLMNLMEMPTVGTRCRERITCDEEERMRHGYEVTTHLRFAPAPDGRTQHKRASVTSSDGESTMELVYAPSASLWRINHRWRRSRDVGFRLDMDNGFWRGKSGNQKPQVTDVSRNVRPGIRLFVHETANSLMVYPRVEEDVDYESFLCSLQYALSRGIQEVFQVEEGELSSERLGKEDRRGILLWESAEGGLGVLRRLVEEAGAVSAVALTALEMLHFGHQESTSDEEECARACYKCLLSYYNQRDHELLDRHIIRDFLMNLSEAETLMGGQDRSYEEQYQWLHKRTDARSDLERQFLDLLFKTNRRLPDYAQRRLKDVDAIPDFFYSPNICIFCDGSVHDQPQQQAIDEQVRKELRLHGYRVIVVRYDHDLGEQIREYNDI